MDTWLQLNELPLRLLQRSTEIPPSVWVRITSKNGFVDLVYDNNSQILDASRMNVQCNIRHIEQN